MYLHEQVTVNKKNESVAFRNMQNGMSPMTITIEATKYKDIKKNNQDNDEQPKHSEQSDEHERQWKKKSEAGQKEGMPGGEERHERAEGSR